MKRKAIPVMLLALLCVALLFSACGKKSAANTDPTAPVFDLKSYEGVYAEEIARRGILELTATGETTAAIAIEWPSSAAQTSYWKMTGTYDAEKNALVYSDATLTEVTVDAQGAKTENVVYTDGSGSFELGGKKLSWTDNASVIQGSSSTFVYVMSSEEYAKQQGTVAATTAPVVVTTPSPTPASASVTPAPAAETPAPAAETPAPAATTPTPATPAPSYTPAEAAKLPKITKSPTNETVTEGGHCYFLAKYEDAIWAVWHFVSPDGTRDLNYEEAAKEFPKMKIEGGMYSQMKLSNIPLEINGWKVYCQYSNRTGAVNTDSATITVNAKGGTATGTATTTAGLPKVTKSPTSEVVPVGGAAIFQARYEDAIWAVWHFVSPDGSRDLTYEEAAKEFPKMQILNGNYSQLLLKSIPAEVDGWKVYCQYSNKVGSVNTDSALITVTSKGGGTAANTTPAAGSTDANAPKITKSPTSETVAEGGTCYFVAKYENAVWAVWHFVSPDGSRDLTYEEAAKEFPTLVIENGMYSQMKLSKIPVELNGWKVYCRYTNRSASADTGMATITVTSKGTPVPTPTPTTVPASGESVVVVTPDVGATVTPAPTDAPYVADWTSVSDFSQAVTGSGVSFSLPVQEALPSGMTVQGYRYKTGAIEVSYADGSGNKMVIRKSNTESGNALSGDTNIYTSAWQMSIKGLTVTCKGNNVDQANVTVNAATFGYGGSNYAITCNTAQEGKGLTTDQINSLINGMQ
ncbi:MAG: hypothetical protein IKO83_08150 [Oscillospiraceae bacterium]|nr:hypothetical protein [Oscillospiraceae bacterium]